MRNAKQILEASLKSIEKGQWFTGDLGTCTRTKTGLEAQGCALGLVSIYGDDFEEARTETREGVKYINYTLRYADEDSPKAVHKAIAALVAAMPKPKLREINAELDRQTQHYAVVLDPLTVEDLQNRRVWLYNDGSWAVPPTPLTKARAAGWFRKAIDLVSTIDDKTLALRELAKV